MNNIAQNISLFYKGPSYLMTSKSSYSDEQTEFNHFSCALVQAEEKLLNHIDEVQKCPAIQ